MSCHKRTIISESESESDNPFVLPAAETVGLFGKHQTHAGHIIKSACQWIYKLCGIFEEYVKSKMQY